MLILAILGITALAITGAAWAAILKGWFPGLRHSGMARIWWSNVGGLLAVYLLLSLAAVTVTAVAQPAFSCPATAKCWVPYNDHASWLPALAFLTWRVSRGGRVSRIILIIWSALGYAAVATTIARVWSVSAVGLLAIHALQVAVLTSPAVYKRTRRNSDSDFSAPGVFRVWPPLWLILAGLLAGLVVTLLYLGNMQWAALPGCGPAGAATDQLPGRCIRLAQGYPLRFLMADQNIPLIDKAALTKDWAQWSLVSFSVCYVLWLSRGPGSWCPLVKPQFPAVWRTGPD